MYNRQDPYKSNTQLTKFTNNKLYSFTKCIRSDCKNVITTVTHCHSLYQRNKSTLFLTYYLGSKSLAASFILVQITRNHKVYFNETLKHIVYTKVYTV